MISYKFECWKCNEWHNAKARNWEELTAISEGLGVEVITLNPATRIRVTNKGKLWLIPLPLGKGLLVGGYPRVFVAPWKVAQWEFADWSHEYTEEASAILKAGRE